ncbi:MAG: ECF-type sigma factor [Gemmataceae bacterium]|nr:ECF-type sigma factor [Gemmataceae bacterium]
MTAITHILDAIDAGDPHAVDQLLPVVYDELRKLAVQWLADEKPGQTLQATALVHEAYLRLVAGPLREHGEQPHFNSRGHLFAAAAEAMRRILIEQARRRQSIKRGGDARREEIDFDHIVAPEPDDELLALHHALERFAEQHPEKAELVKLRYFAGLTADEAAQVLGISPSTGDRHWTFARAWLKRAMSDSKAT